MSDLNGFRKYESAIINGMLASGEYALEDIKENFSAIRATARQFSGSVDSPLYPIGVSWQETDAAQHCLYAFLDKPKTLKSAVDHLLSLGFDERIARYSYNFLMGEIAPKHGKGEITLWEIEGVAMLMRKDYWEQLREGTK